MALLLLSLALFLYPLIGGLLARSEVPLIGPWSPFLLAFNLLGVVTLALGAAALYRKRSGLLSVALLAALALSFTATGNNQLRALPVIPFALVGLRVLLGLSLVVLGLAERRRSRGGWSGPAVAVGLLVTLQAPADAALLAWSHHHRPSGAAAAGGAFRTPPRFDALGEQDIIMVGDSFVWGSGVSQNETFGAVLEQELKSARVCALGVPGTGPRQYLEFLEEAPDEVKVRRVIVALFLNDMPPAPRLRNRVSDLALAVGVSSPTLRVAGELVATALTPSVEEYAGELQADLSPEGPTYLQRWEQLTRQLTAFHQAAMRRSIETPLLIVIPVMVDFEGYPLADAHRRLADLAGRVGFEVFDLLPVFRAELQDGTGYRVTPDDVHFNDEVHRLVGRHLATRLDIGASRPR